MDTEVPLPLYKTAHQQVTLVTGVAQALHLPADSREHVFRLADATVAYSFGIDEAIVNAGNGFPMLAGEMLNVRSPVKKHDLWFRQASGGNIVLHWSYLYLARV